jgi:hypothetical protein
MSHIFIDSPRLPVHHLTEQNGYKEMTNPRRYFVEERKNGTIAIKGQGKERAARVVEKPQEAKAEAHHFAGPHGVVEFKGPDGRFECNCSRCKTNR